MKRFVLAGFALQLCALPALAQSTATNPGTMPNATPHTTTTAPVGTMTPAGTVAPAATAPTGTMGGTVTRTNDASNPAISTSQTAHTGAARGANSFTERQARRRLEKNGYQQVSGLTKGNDGIWRGTAMKNGSSVQVTVDYKGEISMN